MTKHQATKLLIEQEYLTDNRPFVITYSGGKDSTLLLHLFLEMVLDLKKRGVVLKQSYIVSSDTKVEMPIIEKFLEKNLEELNKFCKTEDLKIEVKQIKPDVKNSFFALMIGKGYPPPNRNFRWCTDRLKIRPTLYYFKSLINKHSSIIMLLGVRRDESVTRQQSIDVRERNHRNLSIHDVIHNAYILSPIADWTTDEVWAFLRHNKPYWRETYQELLNIYSKGSGEDECSLSFDQNKPSCGNSRFGCWTCTVVSKDKSMAGMIQSGETSLQSLSDYREYLVEIREDPKKRSSRRKNGVSRMGDFLMETRFELLEKLFQVEQSSGHKLISNNEIEEIQKFWNLDGNLDNRAFLIANNYRKNKFQISESSIDFSTLTGNIELFKRIYEIEKQVKRSGNRRGVLIEIESKVENYFKRSFSENYKN